MYARSGANPTGIDRPEGVIAELDELVYDVLSTRGAEFSIFSAASVAAGDSLVRYFRSLPLCLQNSQPTNPSFDAQGGIPLQIWRPR